MAAVVRSSSLDRDPLNRDFRNFLARVWRELGYGRPSDLQMDIAHYLQHGPDKSIVMAFRGVGKSYETVPFCIWWLRRERDIQVLTVSATTGGAKLNAYFAWQMVNQFDWLEDLRPTSDQRQSAQAFDIRGCKPAKSESFASDSLFGQITGRRADIIVPDDVETPNTAETETKRSQLAHRYGELGGAILKPDGIGLIKVLGTAQTEQTLYTDLAMNKGYGMRMWPCYYPIISLENAKKDTLHRYGPWLAPSIAQAVTLNPSLMGTSTEPTRFDEWTLLEKRTEFGTIEFDRQFFLFLDAGGETSDTLKLRDIPVLEIPTPTPEKPLAVPVEFRWDPMPANRVEGLEVDAKTGDSSVFYASVSSAVRWEPPEVVRMRIDPSGKGEDETVWQVLVEHLGSVGLVHQDARLEGFTSETLKAIAKDAKTWGVQQIDIESNFGGGMFAELLRPHLLEIGHGCTINDEAAGQTQKEARIVDTLTPVVTDHRLWIAANVLRKDWKVAYPKVPDHKRRFYRLTYQLTRIIKRKDCLPHDDRVDTLAAGVRGFLGLLRRRRADAQQASRDAYIEAQAEKIRETLRKQGRPVLGDPPVAITKLPHLLKDLGGMVQSHYFKGRRP
jgi:hypothetical protein